MTGGRPSDVTDSSQWIPLAGLEPGFDAHKADPSPDLDGRELVLELAGGVRVRYEFGVGTLERDGVVTPVEVLPVADRLYYVEHLTGPRAASTVLLDLAYGRALRVDTTLDPPAAPGHPVARQVFRPAELAGSVPAGPAPVPATELIGRRVLYVYSDRHAYEHVYLNEHFYTWQCLRGPEQGQADTDPATVYRLRPDVYLIGWREKVVPCGAVVAINLAAQRSHGMLFGLGEPGPDSSQSVHFTFGAHATPLGEVSYPAGYHPAGGGR